MSVNNKVMLKYLNTKCPVNIEFEDLSYALPQGRKGQLFILIIIYMQKCKLII